MERRDNGYSSKNHEHCEGKGLHVSYSFFHSNFSSGAISLPVFRLPLCFLSRKLWDCYLILLRVNFCEQQSTLYQRRWCLLSDNSAGLMMMILLAVKSTCMAVRRVIPGWLGGGRDNPGCEFFSKLPSPDRPGAVFRGCAVRIPVGPGVRGSTSQSLLLLTAFLVPWHRSEYVTVKHFGLWFYVYSELRGKFVLIVC